MEIDYKSNVLYVTQPKPLTLYRPIVWPITGMHYINVKIRLFLAGRDLQTKVNIKVSAEYKELPVYEKLKVIP